MEPKVIWIVAVIAVAALVAIALGWRQRRSARLRRRFGPEYDRVVQQKHDTRAAEASLEARAKRVEQLHIRPLAPAKAAEFTTAWRKVQAQFVDDPNGAVTRADQLIGDVMRARGYPIDNFDQRADDLSVDHPFVVTNYRAAHEIAARHARGEASTEDLRQAIVLQRSLFEELLVTDVEPREAHHRIPAVARGRQ
jgi:hypothetical protein